MTLGEVLLIPASLLGVLSAIGMIWRGYHSQKKSMVAEAYEQLRSEHIVKEAQETIASKDIELAAKTTAISEYATREERLIIVTDDQRSVITKLSVALERITHSQAVPE